MKNRFIAVLVAGLLASAPALGQPIQYRAADNINNTPVSAATPLPITGSISATNPSVGTGAATAPTSATLIGSSVSGNLQPASSSNPIPVNDAALIAQMATAVPPGANEIGSFSPKVSSLTKGTTSAMTGTTSTVLLAAPAASNYNYLTWIVCWNSHATVDTGVSLQDGSGGTVMASIPAAKLYGGSVITFPTPLKQTTAATGLYVVNETTGASVKCSAGGFTGL